VNRLTGVVLDDQFNPDISPDQKRFTISDTKNQTLKYIEGVMEKRNEIEFVVYGKDESVLNHVNK